MVLTYDFRSAFANPTLRRLFPSAELLEVFLLLFLLLAAFVLVITRQAKYLSRELFHLQEAADEIRNQNLDFTIRPTAICEFNQVAASLDALKSELSASLKEQWHMQQQRRRQFSALAHDIKTPLTSIVNYVELLEHEELSGQAAEYVSVLARQSSRMKKLIDDLVEASKASTGNIETHPEPLDLSVMAGQTDGEYAARLAERDLRLVITGADKPAMVRADSRLVWRIWDNLLGNICKYAMPGTRVYFESSANAGIVTITFKNISKYELNIPAEELMARFVRGDRSRHTEGSGLGLSIAQSLTELQGGTFRLEIDGDLFKAIVSFPQDGTQELHV